LVSVPRHGRTAAGWGLEGRVEEEWVAVRALDEVLLRWSRRCRAVEQHGVLDEVIDVPRGFCVEVVKTLAEDLEATKGRLQHQCTRRCIAFARSTEDEDETA
jgi:hypothetical protein